MAKSKELWHKYFSDFADEKLHVRGDASSAIVTMLRSWHQEKVDQSPSVDAMGHILANLVSLHVSVQHLSKVTSILRPIADLETMAQKIPPDISKGKTRSPHLEIKGSIFEKPEAICLYVVDSLFQPIAQIFIGQTSLEAVSTVVATWNAVYQRIVSVYSMSGIQSLIGKTMYSFPQCRYPYPNSKSGYMNTCHHRLRAN